MLITTSAALTDVGRRREHNEDRFLADDDRALYVVSDGMGGHAAGEVAARMTVEILGGAVAEAPDPVDAKAAARVLAAAVTRACSEVYAAAARTPAQTGMGCTVTALHIVGTQAVICHVGDSRLYVLRGSRAHQLTTDHTMANELALAGAIERSAVKGHPYAHVLTRTVGTQPSVRVDSLVFDTHPGDVFLLCSDGLSDTIDDPEHLARLAGGQPSEELPDVLVAHANGAGGPDNITVIAARVAAAEPQREQVARLTTQAQQRLVALGGVFLFEGLSLRNLARVLQACELRALADGEVVIREGERSAGLFVLLQGRLSLTRQGAEVAAPPPLESFGATTLLGPRPARASVRAVGPGRVLVLTSDAFQALTHQRPWLGVALLERLSRRLGQRLDDAYAPGGAASVSEVF